MCVGFQLTASFGTLRATAPDYGERVKRKIGGGSGDCERPSRQTGYDQMTAPSYDTRIGVAWVLFSTISAFFYRNSFSAAVRSGNQPGQCTKNKKESEDCVYLRLDIRFRRCRLDSRVGRRRGASPIGIGRRT